jgi:hypothetical protein
MVEDSTTEIEENTPEEGELVMPTTAAISDIGMWVHAKENILKNGRTQHQQPEDDGSNPDFDPEEAMKKLEASDPQEKRLKPLTADHGVSTSPNKSLPAWQVRLCGDKTEFVDPKNPKKTLSNGIAVVRSTIWPGAYSFYYNGQVYQTYLGYGHKLEPSRSAFPSHPPMMEDDIDETKNYALQADLNQAPIKEEAKPTEEEAPAEDEEEDN